MKRRLLVTCILFLIVFVFNGCTQEKKINEIVQATYNNITKVVFSNGRTGERTTVKDKEKIKEFMSFVDSYEIKQIEGSPAVKPGTAYSAGFYIGESEAFTLSFISLEPDSNLGINGEEYKVIKTDLTIGKIDSFLKQ